MLCAQSYNNIIDIINKPWLDIRSRKRGGKGEIVWKNEKSNTLPWSRARAVSPWACETRIYSASRSVNFCWSSLLVDAYMLIVYKEEGVCVCKWCGEIGGRGEWAWHGWIQFASCEYDLFSDLHYTLLTNISWFICKDISAQLYSWSLSPWLSLWTIRFRYLTVLLSLL